MALQRVIGENVRAARERRRLTQVELALLANLSRASVAGIEGGRYSSLHLTTLEALGRALRLPVWQLTRPRRRRAGVEV